MATTGETLTNGIILIAAGVVAFIADHTIWGGGNSHAWGMVHSGVLLVFCYFIFRDVKAEEKNED